MASVTFKDISALSIPVIETSLLAGPEINVSYGQMKSTYEFFIKESSYQELDKINIRTFFENALQNKEAPRSLIKKLESFIKDAKKHAPYATLELQELEQFVYAKKLQDSTNTAPYHAWVQLLNEHSIFYHIAKANFFHRSLLSFPHFIYYESNQFLINVQNSYCSIADFENLLGKTIILNSKRILQNYYVTHGTLVEWNNIHWRHLDPEPFRIEEKSPYGNDYVVEVCTCTNKKFPALTGDHTWIRLYEPSGKMFSLGFYRPFKKNFYDHFYFPANTKQGFWICPELSEYTDGVERLDTIPFKITKEQLDAIIEWIRKEKCDYNIINENCSDKIVKILKNICKIDMKRDIEVPLREFFQSSHTWEGQYNSLDSFHACLQNKNFFQSSIDKVYSLSLAFLTAFVLGGRKIRAEVTNVNAKPLYQTITEIFDTSKLNFIIPMQIFRWGEKIKKYREQMEDPFAVPQEYVMSKE